jgi:hypothetical protein
MTRIPSRETERQRSDRLLDGYVAEGGPGEALVRELHPNGDLTVRTLGSYAKVLSIVANVPIRRDWFRRKDLLYKWFHMNSDLLEPYLEFVKFID